MPRHVRSVVCQKGVLDKYTNNVSLLEIIEDIKITPESPLPSGRVNIRASLHLVTLWCRTDRDAPETFEARSVVILPDGSEVAGVPMEAGLQQHRRLRTFMRMEVMPFDGPGVYCFAVEYRSSPKEQWTRVATIPVEIQVAPRADGPKQEEGPTSVASAIASPGESKPVGSEGKPKQRRKGH
jgi:hypothetical protein